MQRHAPTPRLGPRRCVPQPMLALVVLCFASLFWTGTMSRGAVLHDAQPPLPGAVPPPGPARYSDEWVATTLRTFHQRFPTLTRLQSIGLSVEGRPIWALFIGRRLEEQDKRPTVLLNGAHHGVELHSIDMVMDAIEVLLLRSFARSRAGLRHDPVLDRQVARWLQELVVVCVPVVNPDGVWAALHGNPRTGRKNGRDSNGNGQLDPMDGVDLNRNYPFRWGALGEVGSSSNPLSFYFRGPAPASEPETRAMMQLAEVEHPVAAVSFHTGTVALLVPYTIDGSKDPLPNEAWTVAEGIVAGLSPHPQGKPFSLKRKLYSVDGTDQDYYRFRFGTLAYLVEGARRYTPDEAERIALVRAVRPTWTLLLDRFLAGPSLSVTVVDARSIPVAAQVHVEELAPQQGERWESRCRDGRHSRFLPAPGRYTLRVSAPSAPEVTQLVEVSAGHTQVEVRLPVVITPSTCPALPPLR